MNNKLVLLSVSLLVLLSTCSFGHAQGTSTPARLRPSVGRQGGGSDLPPNHLPDSSPDAITAEGELIDFMGEEELMTLIHGCIEASKNHSSAVDLEPIRQQLETNAKAIEALGRRLEMAESIEKRLDSLSAAVLQSNRASDLLETNPRVIQIDPPQSAFLDSTTLPWVTLLLGTFVASLVAMMLSVYRMGQSRQESVSWVREYAPPPTSVDPPREHSFHESAPPARDLHEKAEAEIPSNIDLGEDHSEVILSFPSLASEARREEEQRSEMNSALMTEILNDNLEFTKKAG
jgi:hypothetical protein